MRKKYCYWTVVDGRYAEMLRVTIRTARQCGVNGDFHVWADRAVPLACQHDLGVIDKRHYLFKLEYLRKEVKDLDYDYLVWIDADTVFVRNPGDLLGALRGEPMHASLESDACAASTKRGDWWGCPLPDYARLMRVCGVVGERIFNVNAGFWIVHHDAIDTLYNLAMKFWYVGKAKGFTFTEEAPLAYATHMLCQNLEAHTLRQNSDLWASDWTGIYKNRLPDGRPWSFTDYFTEERFTVNPAIVHAMRSKTAMLRASLDMVPAVRPAHIL